MEFTYAERPVYPGVGMDDLYGQIEADPRGLERSGASFASGGSALAYLGPLGGLIALCGVILGITWPMGMLWVGLLIAGVLMMLTTLIRINLGLMLLAAAIPWEAITRLSDSFTLVKAMGILVAFLGLLHVFFRGAQKWPTTFKILAVFCVWASVGMAAKPSVLGLLGYMALLSNVILVYLCFRFCSEPTALRSLVIVIFISSVGQALLGVLMGIEAGARGRLTTSKDINVNTYVRLMFFGVFLGPIVFACLKSAFARILVAFGLIVSLGAALLTGSRGAVLGIFAGLVLMVLTIRSARFRFGAKLAILVGAAVLVIVAWMFASRSGGGQLWAERLSAQSLSEGVQSRIGRWKASIEMGLENPVLGVGFGNEALTYYFKGIIATESHNDMISVLAMTGIPGLLLYLFFLGAWLLDVWRMPYGIWRSSLLGMWLAFFTTSMFNPSLTKKSLWLGVAICATCIVRAKQFLGTRCELPHADVPAR